jgi:hypothetical protein
MITTSKAGEIIAVDSIRLGMPIYLKGHIPDAPIERCGRVVILPKEESTGKYFSKLFVEVNICLPDVAGEADKRLECLEMKALKMYDEGVADCYFGTWYRYSVQKHSVEEDASLQCHYVHIQLLFEILNVK